MTWVAAPIWPGNTDIVPTLRSWPIAVVYSTSAAVRAFFIRLLADLLSCLLTQPMGALFGAELALADLSFSGSLSTLIPGGDSLYFPPGEKYPGARIAPVVCFKLISLLLRTQQIRAVPLAR